MLKVNVRSLRIVRYSAAKAWNDMWVMYSPLGWCLGWLSRVLMQVVFFAVIGLLLESPEALRYLFVGSALMISAVEALTAVASTAWERWQGTMPLLVAAPSPLWPVFLASNLQWVPSGALTASFSLFLLSPFFGVSWSPSSALMAATCIIVASLSTYMLAMALGGLVLSAMSVRNVVANIAQILMMTICGVVVPVEFWPPWVGGVAQALPLTHALAGLRVAADNPTSVPVADISNDLVLAALTGAGWLLVTVIIFERLVLVGRRSGTIEYAD